MPRAAAARRVATNARIGFRNFKLNEIRRLDQQWFVVPKSYLANILFRQPLFRIANRIAVCPILFKRVRDHEMPELTVRVEILHLGVHDVSRFNRLAGLEGLVDRLSRLEVLDPDAIERLSLARLHELILDDDAGIIVNNDAETGSELAGAVICHDFRSQTSCRQLATRRYDTEVRHGIIVPWSNQPWVSARMRKTSAF